jgi:hypothetical protein
VLRSARRERLGLCTGCSKNMYGVYVTLHEITDIFETSSVCPPGSFFSRITYTQYIFLEHTIHDDSLLNLLRGSEHTCLDRSLQE